jgi:hypothetical protein
MCYEQFALAGATLAAGLPVHYVTLNIMSGCSSINPQFASQYLCSTILRHHTPHAACWRLVMALHGPLQLMARKAGRASPDATRTCATNAVIQLL